MSLMKRGRVWWTFFYVDGLRHQVSTGTGNRRRAEQIEIRLRDEANLRRHQMPLYDPKMIFGELALRFLAKADVRAYHTDRLKVLLPFFADLPIGHISKSTAAEYRRYRHSEKPLTDATINRDLEALRHILFWAVDEGIVSANPLSRLRLIRERRRRRPVMTVEEELRLLEAAAPHLSDIIIAALDTGMRRGELLHQQWRDVDFPRRLLYVTRSKTAEGESREIPLTNRLLELLFEKRREDGFVFLFKEQPIHSIKTAWKGALRRSGIRPLRFHDIRHTFATRLMEAGVLQEVRKALMGHSSGEDVHSIYVHVELPLKRDAIATLERWWQRSQQQTGGQHDTETA